MQKVELIVCFDDETWGDCVFVEIPDNLVGFTDEAVNWLIDNGHTNLDSDVVYVGVLNWDAE